MTIQGVVICSPRLMGRVTGFLLRTDRAVFRVLRSDQTWQLRDLIFLEPGQDVVVTGRQEACCLYARKILIISVGRRPEKGENVYGDPMYPAAAAGGEGLPGR